MFYVNMVDSFMSGWGKAKNGKSRYSISCPTYEIAEAIKKAAKERKEMKYISISDNPPKVKRGDTLKISSADELGEVWRKYVPAFQA